MEEQGKKKSNILLIDIETAPIIANVWGVWDQNIGDNMVARDWFIISFSAKWLGEDEIIYEDLRGEDLLAEDVNDKKLLRHIHYLLNQADVVIAHNGDRFDIKKLKTRFILNNFPPVRKFATIDTLKVARREFAFNRNTLQHLSDLLIEDENMRKQKSQKFIGFELWKECLMDNEEAWEEMRIYNQKDIISLEAIYLKMRPWMRTHPNVAIMDGEYPDRPTCRYCASENVIKRGTRPTSVTIRQQWQCKDCGSYMSTTLDLPDSKDDRRLLAQKRKNVLGN